MAWYAGNSEYRLHNVGLKQANELGIHDMSGNIAEFVQDWWSQLNNFDYIVNPTGPDTPTSYRKIFRNNGYSSGSGAIKVSYRLQWNPVTISNFGFRLVLDVE